MVRKTWVAIVLCSTRGRLGSDSDQGVSVADVEALTLPDGWGGPDVPGLVVELPFEGAIRIERVHRRRRVGTGAEVDGPVRPDGGRGRPRSVLGFPLERPVRI